MVVVEGVARSLDPELNMWGAAEPIAQEWVEQNYGLSGRLQEASDGAEVMGKVLAELPRVLAQAETATVALADMAQNGLRLDEETVRRIALEDARQARGGRLALWIGALALSVLAVAAVIGD